MTASTECAQFTLSEVLSATGGKLFNEHPDILDANDKFTLCTDSRHIQKGEFFIPFTGAHFDGHDFLKQVFEQGACGGLAAELAWINHTGSWQDIYNLVLVPDTQLGYQQLAQFHRQRNQANIIGITGSSGKTTIKEMLATALAQQLKTQKTEKNFNNEFGVPKTLLALQADTELMIVEMAMRGLDQIRPLSECALPDIAVINNIGPAHIGLLGSLDNIATAKLEITDGLDPETGILIINGDDELLVNRAQEKIKTQWGEAGLHRLITYHMQDATNMTTLANGSVQFEYQGHIVTIHQPGAHMVSNALCVLKIAETLNLSTEDTIQGLAHYQPVSGRWEKQSLPAFNNTSLIDDAYNANPDSFKASLEAFLSLPLEQKLSSILILGGMKELGKDSSHYHKELGDWLKNKLEEHTSHVSTVLTVGEEAQLIFESLQTINLENLAVKAFDDIDILNHILVKDIDLDNKIIFLKGSRSVGLDKTTEVLLNAKEQLSAGEINP